MKQPDARDDVLVVIPCLNEEAHLESLLPAILAQAGNGIVVVADGGSTDRSRDIVRRMGQVHPTLFLLDNPKRIQSAGVNLAAKVFGQGKTWLLRIDAHCQYPVGFVRELLRCAAETEATSVVVPMVTSGLACFQKAAAAAQNSVLGTGGAAHRHIGAGRWVEHGHHALLRLDLFMDVGGYDETFSANEDAELDRRLLTAGGRIWLEPAAAITYFPRKSLPRLFGQYRNYGAGRFRNLQRHPAKMRLRQMLPLAVAPAVAVAMLGLALSPLSVHALWLGVPAFVWAITSILAGAVLGMKARCVCAALSGVAAMTMHLGWSLGFLMEGVGGKRHEAPPIPLTFGAATKQAQS